MKFIEQRCITGRGLVFVFEKENQEEFPKLDDIIEHESKKYLVRGLEISRILTSPPILKNRFGVVVREIKEPVDGTSKI